MLDSLTPLTLALLSVAAPLQDGNAGEGRAVRAVPKGVDVMLAELEALDGDVTCSWVRELSLIRGEVADNALREIDRALTSLEQGEPPRPLRLRKSIDGWIAKGAPHNGGLGRVGDSVMRRTYARAGGRSAGTVEDASGAFTSEFADADWALTFSTEFGQVLFAPPRRPTRSSADAVLGLVTPLSTLAPWREEVWAAPWVETPCADGRRVILSMETAHAEGTLTSTTHIVWRETDRFPELVLVQHSWRKGPDDGGPERRVVNSYMTVFLPAPADERPHVGATRPFPFRESMELQWSSEDETVEIVRSTIHRSEILPEGHGMLPRLTVREGPRLYLSGRTSLRDPLRGFGDDPGSWPAAILERIQLP